MLLANLELGNDTIYRDIQKLRLQGYHIPKATKATQYKYVLSAATPLELPFSNRQIASLVESVKILQDQQSPAALNLQEFMSKLRNYLSAEQSEIINDFDLQGPLQDISSTYLTQLSQICNSGHQVIVPYKSLRGNKRNIIFEPVELSLIEGLWYMIGFDLNKKRWLELRVDRIQAKIERLPAKKQRQQRQKYKAIFRLLPPLADDYQKRMNEEITDDPKIEGAIQIKTEYYSDLRFCQYLLRYEQYAEVLEPASMRYRMQQTLPAIYALYNKDNLRLALK